MVIFDNHIELFYQFSNLSTFRIWTKVKFVCGFYFLPMFTK